MKRKPFLQPCCLVLAQKKSKYYISISCLGTGKVEILQFIFLVELVGSDIGKVEILQYYLICVLPDRERKSVRGRQGHQSRCHGLSTFLAELVVFDIGKVEIPQYYPTRLRTEKPKYHNNNSRHAGPPQPGLRTEKSKYHTYNSRHAAPLVAIRKHKSRNLS
jgi:hypothetical protein